MSLSGPTEFEAVAAEDGLTGAGLQGDGHQEPETTSPEIAGRSLWSIAWRRFRQDKVAVGGGIVIVLEVLVALLAPQILGLLHINYLDLHNTPGDNLLNDLTQLPNGDFSGLSAKHPLGVTPSIGQDILGLILFGARTSFIIAGLSTLLSVVLGVLLGVIAGFFRGWVDALISRTMDVLLSFPTLLLSISLITVVSFVSSAQILRFEIIIFVLGFFGWPYLGRIVRGQVLSLREKEFVEAARSLGASNWRIMMREIVPNLVGPILVYTTLTIPTNILGEAGLSFLGIGIQPPTPSWGQMLSDAGTYIQTDPWYLFMPGLAIFISVLAFNLFGDGLRDALDPKSAR